MKLVGAAVLTIAILPGMVAGQVNKAGSVNATTSYTANGTCPADKLQVTSFAASPANPTPGQTVTLKFTVKNSCNGSVNLTVPYKVMNAATTVGSGTVSVAAGATTTLQLSWVATSGQHVFVAYADPNRTLSESNADGVNNISELAVNVAPRLITTVLEGNAGGTTPVHRSQQETVCSLYQTAIGASLAAVAANAAYLKAGAWPISFSHSNFAAPCSVSTEAEAYSGVQLQNGWRVKSVSAVAEGTGGSWSWISKPSVGSTNPALKLKISTQKGYVNYRVNVRVEIEGPEGTSAF